MTIFHSFLLGIIEGVTEFLPISSTFHLIFSTKLLGLPESDFIKFFTVFIQAGAILPVLFLYGKEWFKEKKFLINVAVSFIPTAIIGFLLHKIIKGVFFESELLMLAAFAVVGLGFIVVEKCIKLGWLKTERDIDTITYWQAALIGIFQACAVLPGVSRAGAVIVGMMLLGFKRDQAAKYSFSLAVPTILAAALLDIVKMDSSALLFAQSEWLTLTVGFVTALVSAFIIIRWFVNYLRKNSLVAFGVYRLLAVAVLLILGMWR
jgi:undecaprenyl-diphosphatase